jgi:hypothetical protein
VLEQSERALTEPADRGGKPGGRLVGQDPSPGVVDERAVDADEGIRNDLRSEVVCRGIGLGDEQGSEGVGGAGERLLLSSQQGWTGGDHAVEGPQPLQRLGITRLHLGEQPTGLQEVAPVGHKHRLPGGPGADGVDQVSPEGLEPVVEEVFLVGK